METFKCLTCNEVFEGISLVWVHEDLNHELVTAFSLDN